MQKFFLITILLFLILLTACEESDEPITPPDNLTLVSTEKSPFLVPLEISLPEPAISNTSTPQTPPPPILESTLPAPEATQPLQEPITTTSEPKQETPPQPPTPKPILQQTEIPIAPTPTPKIFVPNMAEKLQQLINLADEKVKSYEFVLAPPPDNLARDHYYIKGKRYRISLYQNNFYKPDEYFDTVYVDTVTKTAIGYCEGNRPGRCINSSTQYTLPYTQWLITTPYQWLKQIPYGEIQGSEKIFDRPSFKVYYEKDGIATWMWLDEYSGLPARVLQKKQDKETKTEFRYLAINTVTDDYVIHTP
ncbi:MAG: hypothetical protein AABX52_02860 [Nanoarchaeota archaeon]